MASRNHSHLLLTNLSPTSLATHTAYTQRRAPILRELRTRTRDILSEHHSFARDVPADHYHDTPISPTAGSQPDGVSPFSKPTFAQRSSLRASMAATSPFGRLNVPGNALLPNSSTGSLHSLAPPMFRMEADELSPTSPSGTPNPFASFANGDVTPHGDYLQPPESTIFARRASVSAESIAVDEEPDEPLPNFIFRDLDEEQETGVLMAMREVRATKDEVVIRQGDVGDFFYVVEAGWLDCFIRPEPLPPAWLTGTRRPRRSGGRDGPCTLWSLDRITFRTIISRRRTGAYMYEQFLSSIADALVSKVHEDGEPVVRQGDMGDTFFFVEDGVAVVTKTERTEDGQSREVEVNRLTKGDYFGELSLLRREPRAATVSAVSRADRSAPKLKVAALDANAFTRLLGPLREIMERNAGQAYGAVPRMSR
ncbi:uncharacterized protein B0H18DRAFT_967537 [Fomitopsis serialis]|uniref:uncharacterized protein n=1 Tax=Fomitopsis serialis TaxID=139415 RepID=UPI00200801E5|nr:uncharacterized protein B0H18DRAFT_967537 [Neoantrodia serialis]KAH9938521.1 hypothetical protein B0H18DRAFT_967537 [Neoantrodia serialis]